MIAKITKGSSPAGALRYAMEKEGGELLDTNCASKDWQGIATEMDTMAEGNKRCEKHCIHITLSAPPGERLTDDQWRQAAHATKRELGLENNQFALVRHTDKDHDHAHLIVERVDQNGKAWNDKFERTRTHNAMRVVEQELGLQKFNDHTPTKDGRFEGVKKDLNDSIKSAGDRGLDGFKSEMDKRGYDVVENRQSTGRLAGLSIKSREDGKTWKSSELQKGGAWAIEKRLESQKERTLNQQKAAGASVSRSAGQAVSGALGGAIANPLKSLSSSPISGLGGVGGIGGKIASAIIKSTPKPKSKQKER